VKIKLLKISINKKIIIKNPDLRSGFLFLVLLFYHINGILTHRKTIRSLNNIYIPSHISNIKNARLMYHSILKYFSGLNLHIHCIKLHNILPQSRAGIGNILNIARAKDIIQANHK
jgi:hypothetical protein